MKALARALTLAFLSAVTAEFLLGDQWLSGIPPAGEQIAEVLLYAAFYGSAAILIREVARRTGRGWPTILTLAFAFGVIEEGVVDQSLFNPDFVGAHLLANGFIPWLGIGGPWTIYVLSLHVIWSIGAPIAVVEGLFPTPLPGHPARPPQVQGPWLSRAGIVTFSALAVLSGAAIHFATTVGFTAAWWQLFASAAVAAVAVVVALRLPRRVPRPQGNVWPALVISAIVTSAYHVVERAIAPTGWTAVALEVGILAIGVALAIALRLDPFGLGVGAILTYCWLGLTKAIPLGPGATIEQVVLVALAVALIAVAAARRPSRALA